ncbi:MAG: hypothetical protein CL663_02705 [Bacteroidetes bacterium]|nr:hypothetical protein [Bacteroidota bacterium]|tara:strand:+ start:587 stop:1180 length:594 start_codon:yes stop_codon:yes gene_type:complete
MFKGKLCIVICLVLILCIPQDAWAKKKKKRDKAKKEQVSTREHSPHKATIRSLIIPGWGQAYNKKYWKIPIVYAGLGTFGYMAFSNRAEYQRYKTAYEYVLAGEEGDPPNAYAERYSQSQLQTGQELYQRNMELSFILMGLWYLINVIDATVDAHLFQFEVSDDLSFQVEPDFLYQPQFNNHTTGIKVRINLPFKAK